VHDAEEHQDREPVPGGPRPGRCAGACTARGRLAVRCRLVVDRGRARLLLLAHPRPPMMKGHGARTSTPTKSHSIRILGDVTRNHTAMAHRNGLATASATPTWYMMPKNTPCTGTPDVNPKIAHPTA